MSLPGQSELTLQMASSLMEFVRYMSDAAEIPFGETAAKLFEKGIFSKEIYENYKKFCTTESGKDDTTRQNARKAKKKALANATHDPMRKYTPFAQLDKSLLHGLHMGCIDHLKQIADASGIPLVEICHALFGTTLISTTHIKQMVGAVGTHFNAQKDRMILKYYQTDSVNDGTASPARIRILESLLVDSIAKTFTPIYSIRTEGLNCPNRRFYKQRGDFWSCSLKQLHTIMSKCCDERIATWRIKRKASMKEHLPVTKGIRDTFHHDSFPCFRRYRVYSHIDKKEHPDSHFFLTNDEKEKGTYTHVCVFTEQWGISAETLKYKVLLYHDRTKMCTIRTVLTSSWMKQQKNHVPVIHDWKPVQVSTPLLYLENTMPDLTAMTFFQMKKLVQMLLDES